MKEQIDTYCGLCCATCEYKEENKCKGCISSGGKPFHGECEIAECAKKKNIRFCGECSDFPCDILKKYSYDEKYGDNPKGARIEKCKSYKTALVKEARDGINPIGYCGHHCDYCFLGQFCGGCRSNYNCCSYATLFEDKVCPNVKCSKSRGLDGCYECDLLDKCEKGYYSNKNEYVAKATAKFINKYGLDCYTKTLKNAVQNKVNYPKDFDNTGSIDSALKLLESFIL